MSTPASASTPAPPAPRGRLTPRRLLGAVAFAALGFVAVWQGFGLAGYGTDAHALRVVAAIAPLFVCGLVLVWPRMWTPVRVAAVLIGLGVAGWAWWSVPNLMEPGAMSLRDAVAARDSYKEHFATPTVEVFAQHGSLNRIQRLGTAYPSLTTDLPGDYFRWVKGVADGVSARYRQASHDDFQTVSSLREPAKRLAETYPPIADQLDSAYREWLDRARNARTDELAKCPHGDWAAFDRAAPRRKALADTFPDAADALERAEAEWVDSSVELIVSNALNPKPNEPAPAREFWLETHRDLLALASLDATAGRFSKARLRLFTVAHSAAKAEATAHLDAGRYDRAFGVARKHAVDWDATAAILGRDEQNQLASLRATCEFLDALAGKAAKPAEPADIAPEPRPKPDK